MQRVCVGLFLFVKEVVVTSNIKKLTTPRIPTIYEFGNQTDDEIKMVRGLTPGKAPCIIMFALGRCLAVLEDVDNYEESDSIADKTLMCSHFGTLNRKQPSAIGDIEGYIITDSNPIEHIEFA